jgi:hypothetical protein
VSKKKKAPPITSGSQFDTEKYLQHINAADPLRAVLGGHLFIEAALGELIEAVLPFPQSAKVTGLRFDERLRWASALGILHPSEVPAYQAVNDLRNELAHGLAETVTVGQVGDLIGRLNEDQTERIRGIVGGDPKAGLHLLEVLITLFVELKSRLDVLPDTARLQPGKTWRGLTTDRR